LRLAEITPHSFRNLSPEAVSVSSGVTLLWGENGQGKTNLLEAIAVLSGQRSFRGAVPAAMAPDGESLSVSGTLRRSFEVERLSVTWSAGASRRFRQGEKAVTYGEAARLLPCVFLAPEHRELVLGPPSARRRFLDRLAVSIFPAAADEISRYAKALASRNALLSRVKDRRGEVAAGELEAWTEELALSGAAVRSHRARAHHVWNQHFKVLSGEAGPAYEAVETSLSATQGEAEEIRLACARLLPAERRRGYTLCGPHRDDLLFARGGAPLSATASSGEVHRVAALSKLAEWHATTQAAGEPALLCIDDFDMGLSPAAAGAFWDSLPREAAAILTTASDPACWRSRAAAVYEMRQGSAIAREARRAVND
jgi:DNA replication and repair protein RecF